MVDRRRNLLGGWFDFHCRVHGLDNGAGIFRETELASKVMSDVTNSLVDLLELNVTEQRLDSTHVFSCLRPVLMRMMFSLSQAQSPRQPVNRTRTQLRRYAISSGSRIIFPGRWLPIHPMAAMIMCRMLRKTRFDILKAA